ncbi:hypothetical protein TrVE_jg2978 [Triparma verrucosa]|uniref:Serine/threonine-protein phosphatase 2A 55 kDa regulatory subunit B n=1 Tax=Triparma verrucosa TaxID=1606542 RepID=A0A9W7FFM3_9STRA|nr:hypothetical protein TrVE_jg2978 [Triparma verrucosa]
MSSHGLHLTQCFGEPVSEAEIADADTLSAVQFDATGDYLATGDKGGRIVIFSRLDNDDPGAGHQYMPYAEFQSHESEFDYLKSLEIEERINQIQWCNPTNNALFLLSTNDKTIKLWKIYNKTLRYWEDRNAEEEGDEDRYKASPPASLSATPLQFPKKIATEKTVVANPRRVFSNAHNYHVNSISTNCDGETFISADDLRINLWNSEISDQCYNIVDIKPDAMEDLTEVITSAHFHPSHCHVMLHSSSKGTIKIGDLRASALIDNNAKVLSCPSPLGESKSFFSEIITSISDARFSPDGRYVVSRDYMSLKLWDVNMDSTPVQTIQIQQHLTPRFVQLYENDCIFDKFECAVSGDGKYVASGTYGSTFKIYDVEGGGIEAKVTMGSDGLGDASYSVEGGEGGEGEVNFREKVLHLSWEKHRDTLAVCGSNRLYIYSGQRDGNGKLCNFDGFGRPETDEEETK